MPAGQLLLAKGDVEQAFNTFKIVLDGDPDNVPALLGQVFITSIFWGLEKEFAVLPVMKTARILFCIICKGSLCISVFSLCLVICDSLCYKQLL